MEYGFKTLHSLLHKGDELYMRKVFSVRESFVEILPYHLFFTREDAIVRLDKINQELKSIGEKYKYIYREEIYFLEFLISPTTKYNYLYEILQRKQYNGFNDAFSRLSFYYRLLTRERSVEDIVRDITMIITIFPELFSPYKDFEKISMNKSDSELKSLYIESMKNLGVYHKCEILLTNTNFTNLFINKYADYPPYYDKLAEVKYIQDYFNENIMYRSYINCKDILKSLGYYHKKISRIHYPYTICDNMPEKLAVSNKENIYYGYGEKWYDFFFKKKDVLKILGQLQDSSIPKNVYSDYKSYVREFEKSNYTYFLDYMISEGKIINVNQNKFFALKLRGLLLYFSHNDTDFQISHDIGKKYFYQFFDVLTGYILYIAVNHYYPKELIDKILVARNLARTLALKGKVDETLVDKIGTIIKDNNHEIYNIYDRFKAISLTLEPMTYEREELNMARSRDLVLQNDIRARIFLYKGMSPQERLYNYIVSENINKIKIERMKVNYEKQTKYAEQNKEKIEEERKKYREERNKLQEGNECTNLTDLSMEDIRHDKPGIYIIEENGKKYCYSEEDIEGLNHVSRMPYTNAPITVIGLGNKIKKCKEKTMIFENGTVRC